MSTVAGAALVLIATAGAQPAAPVPHLAEIKMFASTVAVARTVRDECGVSINEDFLESLRQRLHVVESDYPAYVPEARAAAEVFQKDLAKASSRQAWCGAVFRLYGPDETMIRCLLRR